MNLMNSEDLLLEGRWLQSKILFKNKKMIMIGKFIDWYLGWFVRYLWSRDSKIDVNKVLFISFNKQYTCNPKYICRELIKQDVNHKIDIVWLTNNDKYVSNTPCPARVRQVCIGTAEAYKEIMTSKIVVQNAHLSQEYGYLPKMSGQYYFQTWHGSLGFKRFDAKSDSNKKRVKAAIRAGKHTDFFLSNSTFESKNVAPVFWKNAQLIESGHARNDILINFNADCVNSIKQRLSIEKNTRVILYAPTYRDNKSIEHFKIDFNEIIDAAKEKYGGSWVVLVKLHYSNRQNAKEIADNKNVINVSRYPDIQELMLISDIGITDYSSWILDYLLMLRPAFIYAEDIEDYEVERGFYYPLSSAPFPVARNSKELATNIIGFDYDSYKTKAKSFLSEKGCMETGNASKAATEKILELMD